MLTIPPTPHTLCPGPPAVTKRLWQQRYQWTEQKLAEAAPRDPEVAAAAARPGKLVRISYPFTSDPVLREHVS